MSFIKNINKKEDSIILELYEGEDVQINDDNQLANIDKDSDIIRVCFLDVETTGFDIDKDEMSISEVNEIKIELEDDSGNQKTIIFLINPKKF